MKTQHDYDRLISDLTKIEDRWNAEHNDQEGFTLAYLTDSNVDAENVDSNVKVGSDEYWDAMYRSAAMAAGFRGEDLGIDVNAALGYIVY